VDDHAVLDIPQAVGWFGLIVPVLGVADHTHPRPKDIGDSTENVVCSVPELVVGQNKGIAPDWVYSTFRWLRYNHSGYSTEKLAEVDVVVLVLHTGLLTKHKGLCAQPATPLQFQVLCVQQVLLLLSLIFIHSAHAHAVVPQEPLIEHSAFNIEYWILDWLISGNHELQIREEHSALLLQFCDAGVQLG